VLDLQKIAETFIRTKLQSFEADNVADEAVLHVICRTELDCADRERGLSKWLNLYRVLLFFPPDKSKEIVG
jgi:hypothetical protein